MQRDIVELSLKRNIIVKAAIMLIIILFSSTIVFAGYGYGNSSTFSAGNKKYVGQSYVFTNDWAYGFQRTCCKSSAASSGWLGNKARLYYSSGVLKGSSSWAYNSSKKAKGSYEINVWGFNSATGSSFYSKGYSAGWNSTTSTYVTKGTSKSPNQTSE